MSVIERLNKGEYREIMKKRILCILLVVAMLVPLMLAQPPKAEAAEVTKREISRVISIVFDNSGSMYEEDGKPINAWCRATYAMEVFASMLNAGDKLLIYPMHPIQDGKNGSTITAPLVINGPNDAGKIRNIYTPVTGLTPFSAVEAAYAGLRAATADQKYLIVLTDGEFDDMDKQTLEGKLNEYSQAVNVMYLGISDAALELEESDTSRQYYQKATESKQVLSKLTEMCNRIFGRTELKASNNKVSFDVSVGKLILFVQGENISDVKVSGGTMVSGKEMKYSSLGRGGHVGSNGAYKDKTNFFSMDESLQGMLVTYENLDAGSYSISYSGDNPTVSVYYEPDVDLQVKLLYEGMEVDPSKDTMYPGQYTLTYGLVDKYGKPTNSSLLGKAKYKITYVLDGQTQTIERTSSGSVPITLKEGDQIDPHFEVIYLNDYTIRKTGLHFGWPSFGLDIKPWPKGTVEMRVSGGANVYDLSKLEQEAKYHVGVLYEGQPVTGNALNRATLNVAILNGNAQYDIQKTADGFDVTLKYYNGSAPDTQCGSQSMELTINYVDEHGQEASNFSKQQFEIRDDSKGMEAELKLEKDYYVISQLDKEAPIILNLTSGGQPLTAEQFAATKVDIKLDGVPHEIQPDPENSRYLIVMKSDGAKSGNFDIAYVVNGQDTLGRPITLDGSRSMELQPYPEYVRVLFWVVLIGLLLLIFFLFMNQKVLPKNIEIRSYDYRLGTNRLRSRANCDYHGGNKKRGEMTINPPTSTNTVAKGCRITLDLEAASTRWTPSDQRTVIVRGVTIGSKKITEIKVGGSRIERDSSNKYFLRGSKETNIKTDLSIEITDGASVKIFATVPASGGNGTIRSELNVNLKFG